MSNQAIKTNNDARYFQDKVNLRIKSIKHLENVNVLDLFGGEGLLWNEVKRQTNKNIKVLSIDKNNYKKIQLKGDNIKFIKSINLNNYDVIDVDAWGSPFYQLEQIFESDYKGIVHCTNIQVMQGGLPTKLLYDYGITANMLKKIKSIFYKNGQAKLENYLAKKGINKIFISSHQNKNYFYFIIS